MKCVSALSSVRDTETALADVLGRHEVLRTILPADVQPYQQVLGFDEIGWELPVTPVTSLSLTETVTEIAAEPFDLQRQIPLRARLLAVGPDLHVLVLVLHERDKAIEVMTKLAEEDSTNRLYKRQLVRYRNGALDSPKPDREDG